MFSITEIIEIAIQLEKNGEKVYREAIGQSKNIEMDDLLLGIAQEELEHIDWFLSLKDEIEKSQDRSQVEGNGSAIDRRHNRKTNVFTCRC